MLTGNYFPTIDDNNPTPLRPVKEDFRPFKYPFSPDLIEVHTQPALSRALTWVVGKLL